MCTVIVFAMRPLWSFAPAMTQLLCGCATFSCKTVLFWKMIENITYTEHCTWKIGISPQ